MTYKTPPTFLGSSDPTRQRREHQPPRLDNLADDVTLGAGVFNGTVQGPRTFARHRPTRALHEFQEFLHIGPYGESGIVEDCAVTVAGGPIANIAVVHKMSHSALRIPIEG
ncbi:MULTISPECIES: hypothetical protein [unclassified Streptomyces]|uniref:hypothetical protein n=1 Tax=unclassified Streptomyces TaxID=2593676 RepID=UPI0011CE10AB|nr:MULTISPECIES: hypothetical protein [unclassified Streptomyces]TXS70118.1 hypothetical protein EAO69_25010 [Streptomyces sp. me109]